MHRARKFSVVLGHLLRKSSITILPTYSSSIVMSKNTRGWSGRDAGGTGAGMLLLKLQIFISFEDSNKGKKGEKS